MENKIYILMATYNGEKYINEQINSLLNQTYKNWKLIIHDDNSKDNTIKIIKNYEKQYPNKIKLIDDNISTGGAKENFTYLLTNIDEDYDYIMFCDQDDVWIEDKIETTLNTMIKAEENDINKPILIHTDLIIVNKNLEVIHNSFFKYKCFEKNPNIYSLFLENNVTGNTIMINKKVLSLFDKIHPNSIMHDWWLAMIVTHYGKIYFNPNKTIYYRQHDSNVVGVNNKNLTRKILKTFSLIRKYINHYQSIKIKLNFLLIIKESLILIKRKVKC